MPRREQAEAVRQQLRDRLEDFEDLLLAIAIATDQLKPAPLHDPTLEPYERQRTGFRANVG